MDDRIDEYLCADSWTIKEGINILAGQDVYNEDDIIKDGLPSEIRDFAINLEWHTIRAQKAGTLPILYEPHGNNHLDNVLYRHVRPKEFIEWAQQKRFSIPIELAHHFQCILQEAQAEFDTAWDDAIKADKIKLKIAEVEAIKPISIDDFKQKEALLKTLREEVDRLNSGEPQRETDPPAKPLPQNDAEPQPGQAQEAAISTKKLIKIADELLMGSRGSITDIQHRRLLAFKYREKPNLPWRRAYKDLPGTGGLSKNPKSQETYFYRWAREGEALCRERAEM